MKQPSSLPVAWEKEIRKAITGNVKESKRRQQLLALLDRKSMKSALGSLLLEMKKHPEQDGDSRDDRLRLIWNVLDHCVTAQNMPKDIPSPLWNSEALSKVADRSDKLAAQFGDISKGSLFLGHPAEDGKYLDLGVVAELLRFVAGNLRSIASNPETLQIVQSGMFPNLKPGQGNRPDLREWRLVHGLATMFHRRLGGPRYDLMTKFYNATFKTRKAASDVEKIHNRMFEKGMVPPPHPGIDGALTSI